MGTDYVFLKTYATTVAPSVMMDVMALVQLKLVGHVTGRVLRLATKQAFLWSQALPATARIFS